ncbi:MAG TPA: hypothetical protein VGS08_04390 [Candidatus Saccharimonadales bacterium]|nr:hypothetical protein [Candidatus Saccharimonadales bacterium]
MSKAATRKDVDDVIEIIHDLMDHISKQFDRVDMRLTEVNKDSIIWIKSMITLLQPSMVSFGRIDRYETELAARDSQFERLLAWARKVSLKTGIPLENL